MATTQSKKAESQEVGVYQLKNGLWAYRFIVKINGEQKTQRRSKDEEGNPFKTQKQAARARKKALEKVQAEAPPAAAPKGKEIVRKRIREVYEEYCECGRKDKAYATIKKQEALWNNHILARFGSCYVDNVRVADVQDFLSELYCVNGYAYGYVEGFLKQFYLIFGQAYSRNYLSVDDYNKLCVNKNTKIKMPTKKSTDITDIEVYTDEELKFLDEYFKGKTVETAYMIGRYCGLRVAECYGLTWDRINLEEGYISIERQMKTHDGLVYLNALKTPNARRKVFICDTLKEYLINLQEQIKEYEVVYQKQREQNEIKVIDAAGGTVSSLRLVNTLPNGKIQTEHAIRHYRQHILKIADVEFKYHNLRHTFGTKLALMNTPEHILLKQMGHSKSSTTHKYYLAMSEQAVEELRSNLNKL